MEDILLLDAIERYLNGVMLPEEKKYFEQMRKNSPEIDQMVVEHKLFLQQMDTYSERIALRDTLHQVHADLLESGEINEGGEISSKAKVVQLWHRYKREIAIAASIAGITAIMISGLVSYFAPTVNKNQLQQLNGEIISIKRENQNQDRKLKELATDNKVAPGPVLSTGTAFLIDSKGYVVTNAHVLKGNTAILVNNKGEEFKARILNIDQAKDIAILKIQDNDFEPFNSLPYALKKSDANLGSELFTLGYPKGEIVYSMGYMSAKSGLNGDTSNFQLSLTANPGNSGGPVFNKNGEIVGVLSTRQTQAEGVVFAVKAKSIFKMVDELKDKDTSISKIKMPLTSSIKNKDRENQIKEVEDCIFLVKAYK